VRTSASLCSRCLTDGAIDRCSPPVRRNSKPRSPRIDLGRVDRHDNLTESRPAPIASLVRTRAEAAARRHVQALWYEDLHHLREHYMAKHRPSRARACPRAAPEGVKGLSRSSCLVSHQRLECDVTLARGAQRRALREASTDKPASRPPDRVLQCRAITVCLRSFDREETEGSSTCSS